MAERDNFTRQNIDFSGKNVDIDVRKSASLPGVGRGTRGTPIERKEIRVTEEGGQGVAGILEEEYKKQWDTARRGLKKVAIGAAVAGIAAKTKKKSYLAREAERKEEARRQEEEYKKREDLSKEDVYLEPIIKEGAGEKKGGEEAPESEEVPEEEEEGEGAGEEEGEEEAPESEEVPEGEEEEEPESEEVPEGEEEKEGEEEPAADQEKKEEDEKSLTKKLRKKIAEKAKEKVKEKIKKKAKEASSRLWQRLTARLAARLGVAVVGGGTVAIIVGIIILIIFLVIVLVVVIVFFVKAQKDCDSTASGQAFCSAFKLPGGMGYGNGNLGGPSAYGPSGGTGEPNGWEVNLVAGQGDRQLSEVDPRLIDFINCIHSGFPATATTNAWQVTSLSDSAGFATCQGNSWTDPACAHGQWSCHYGGHNCDRSVAFDVQPVDSARRSDINDPIYVGLRAGASSCNTQMNLGAGFLNETTSNNHIHLSVMDTECNCAENLTPP